jgi:hypothetical protein
MPLTVELTVFKSLNAAIPERKCMSWQEVVERVEHPQTYSTKADCPLVKLGTFGERRTEKGSARFDDNMLAISGVEGDYDGGIVSPADAARMMGEAGITGLIYTSPSHTPENPRWRVLAPFSEPVAPQERAKYVDLLNGVLGGILAQESWTMSQTFYIGRVAGREYLTYSVEGMELDFQALLVNMPPIGKNGINQTPVARPESKDTWAWEQEDRTGVENWTRLVVTGESYHGPLRDLAAHYAAMGMPAKSIEKTLGGLMQSVPIDQHDQRWKERWSEIPKLAKSAVAKFSPDAGVSASLRFALLSPAELVALPTMRELVRGVLPETGLGAIFGPSGSGKSFLTLDLLGSITTGRDWFEHAVTNPCKAVYVGLEGEAGIAKRVQAFMAKHGPLDGLRVILSALDIRQADDRAALVEAIKAQGFDGGVLILDTLNRAAPGMDENSSVDMGEVIAGMKALQADLGGLVLAVHHSGKDVLKGLRGHSSLLAALDCVIEVSRNEERREWKLSKSKDGEDGKAHPFRLQVSELGFDDDGYSVTSCTIGPEVASAESGGRAKVPGGGNMRLAWDRLVEMLSQSDQFGKASAPPSSPCVELEAATTYISERMLCDQKRRRERTQTAMTGLINRGLIIHDGGWIWRN